MPILLWIGPSSTALSKLLMASTRSSLRTSRTTNEVVVAPRPAWKDPTEEIPTSAKFFRPAGWSMLLTGPERSFQVIGLLIEYERFW